MVEHVTENHGVTGSTPVLATTAALEAPRASHPMSNAEPRVITASDPARLVIDWADGERTIFSAAQLRASCPCARCVNELTGVRMHDPASVPADLAQNEARLVGNYALAFRFSDGHDTGIYPFAMLRAQPPPPARA